MATYADLVKKSFNKVEEYKEINAKTEELKSSFEDLKKSNNDELRRTDEIIKNHELSLKKILVEIEDAKDKLAKLKEEEDLVRNNILDLKLERSEIESNIAKVKDRLMDSVFEYDSSMSRMSNESDSARMKLGLLSEKIEEEQSRYASLVNVNDELEKKAKDMMIQQSLDAEEYNKIKGKLRQAKEIIKQANL